MTKTLYEDAIADAKRLRALAEETAKNKLVETIMPQIREMVNKKILGEQLDDEYPAEDDFSFDADEFEVHPEPVEDFEIITPHALNEPPMPSGESFTGSTDSVINIDSQGDVNIDLDSDDSDEEDQLVLSDTMAETLLRLLDGESKNKLSEKLTRLENTFNKLTTVLESVNKTDLSSLQLARINKSFSLCVKEAHKLQKQLILNEQATQEDLEPRLTIMIKEMQNMSKSNSRNIFDFLFEAEDIKKENELEEAELALQLSDEEREELVGAEDTEAVDVALDDILGDLEVSIGGEEADAGEEPADADAEADPEAMGDAEAEADVEDDAEDLDLGETEVYEIDESTLRRELARLTEEAADEADQFGGGEAPMGDVFVDVDEEDLINALADELGSAAAEPTVESRRRTSSPARLREANRAITVQNRTINELKKQLVEMNLFNAKLLYANKLMQNKNLSMKQQRSIVEALDNAKTIREAKLLFKGMSKSLVKKGRKSLQESALLKAGSSSRATKTSQPATSDSDTARWAQLAGI